MKNYIEKGCYHHTTTRVIMTASKKTELHRLHEESGGTMVDFGGYSLALHYEGGISEEHRHTRNMTSLFDISHMRQIELSGKDSKVLLERIVVGDIGGIVDGGLLYTLVTNGVGGIIDDIVVSYYGDDRYIIVSNANRGGEVLRHIEETKVSSMLAGVDVRLLDERALIAIQGPLASKLLSRYTESLEGLKFMQSCGIKLAGIRCQLARCGYTGEDGFEISLLGREVEGLSRLLLEENEELRLAGLGARDSLRLEAGLCLYGKDIDENTTPYEASLGFTVSKEKLANDNFIGSSVIREKKDRGGYKRRIGIVLQEKNIARGGNIIYSEGGEEIGIVSSGCYGFSIGKSIAMGYIRGEYAKTGTLLKIDIRNRHREGEVVRLPFKEHKYYR